MIIYCSHYSANFYQREFIMSMVISHQLTRRIYVEASSATENAIDVVYSWQF